MKLRSVPAATGLEWVKLGVITFLKQPLAMSGLFFLFMAAVSLLALVPLLGPVLATLLTPAINLGLMSATREAQAGRFPMPVQLLTAFRSGPEKGRGIMTLGGLYALGLLMIMLMAGLLQSSAQAPEAMTTAETMRMVISSPALWMAVLAMLPLQMLFWYAPALLFWHGVPPLKSVFFSLMACWTNRRALVMFLLGWIGLFVVLSLALSLVGALLGGSQMAGLIVYPAVLFMASMFFTSIWFAFQGSFEVEDGSAPNAINTSA